MTGHSPTESGNTLSNEQLRAAQMLVAGTRLREIALSLSVSERTIQRWSKLPAFEAFLQEVRKKAREKTVDKLEKDLSTTLEKLANEHLRCHQMVRQMAENALEVLSNKNLDDINPRVLATWSTVLARHIEGERQASSLQYLDLNKAIALVCQAGYEVRDPGLNAPQPDEDNL